MADAIENLRNILGDLPIEAFEADVRTRWSVERGLEIVSGIAARL
jgi:hypothetical protein